jgi:hypothetical protein
MTLLILAGNRDYTVLVSDRRVTSQSDRAILSDEHNKATVLVCDDARMAVTFMGVAGDGRAFNTRYWLQEALAEAAQPEASIFGIVARLREIASRDIGALALSQSEKRLTILVGGYRYGDGPPPR